MNSLRIYQVLAILTVLLVVLKLIYEALSSTVQVMTLLLTFPMTQILYVKLHVSRCKTTAQAPGAASGMDIVAFLIPVPYPLMANLFLGFLIIYCLGVLTIIVLLAAASIASPLLHMLPSMLTVKVTVPHATPRCFDILL